jgi:hypothetical protein
MSPQNGDTVVGDTDNRAFDFRFLFGGVTKTSLRRKTYFKLSCLEVIFDFSFSLLSEVLVTSIGSCN